MEFLHFCLCFMLCMCGLLMCLTVSPVESVLFLILAFCNAAAILFIFHAEFLGLIFIIIYVGAIAVLFLFVIMMLNVKNQENEILPDFFTKGGALRSILVGLSFGLCVGYLAAAIIDLSFALFKADVSFFYNQHTDLILMIDNLNNIDVMGQVLFNYNLICFLLAGIILLIALIGSIVLTLRFNNLEKGQCVNRQLARTDNFLSFYK